MRSLLFNILFVANFVVTGVAMLPTLLLPRRAMFACVRAWARTCLWLLRHVAGLRLEFRGREHIPPGPLLVAAKHQSTLETLALVLAFDDPTFILKRELMWIPFFGWYAWKARMIPIHRGRGSRALREMTALAGMALDEGRQVVIFPEGTRRAVDAVPAYKFGVGHLYEALGAAVLPVALDTGLFWPRRRWEKQPGTAVVEFLEPLPPGLDREVFQAALQDRIETATTALVAEARQRRLGRRLNRSATIGAVPG